MTPPLIPTRLPGLILLQPEPISDTRGSFTRLSCVSTLAAHGIEFLPTQTSISRSSLRGTLRGMHFQLPPSTEIKIVHCIAGAVFDVVLDLRPDSPTFQKHVATELNDGQGVLVPAGCAHGLLTLTDDAAVLYQIDREHDPERARGVRWDDPAFAIVWPFTPVVMSDRDANWPDFVP